MADESDGRRARTDAEIGEVLQASPDTVARVRKRFVMESFEAAVNPRPRPPRPDKIKIQDASEQKLIELTCSDPPDGRGTWTLQLLADNLVVLGYVESVGREVAGSNPAVLTDVTYRVEVQMEARLLWEQEATNPWSVPGFDSEVPDLRTVVEGWLPPVIQETGRLITELH